MFLDFSASVHISISKQPAPLLPPFDYYNSLNYNLPDSQLNRLQVILNSLARAVVKAPKSSRITHSLNRRLA